MPGWITTTYNYLYTNPEAMLIALGVLIIGSWVWERVVQTSVSKSVTVGIQASLVAAAVFVAFLVLR